MGVTAAIGSAVIGVGGSLLAAQSQSKGATQAANTEAQAANQATATQLQMYNQTSANLSPFLQTGQGALSALTSFLGPQGPVNSSLSQLSGYYSPSGPLANFYGQNGPLANVYGPQGSLTNLYGPSGPVSSMLGLGPNGAAGMNDQLAKYPGYQFALDQGQKSLDRSAASRGLLLSGGQLKDSQAYGQGAASQLYGTYLGQLGNYGAALGNYGTGLINYGAGIGSYGAGIGGVASAYGNYGNEIAGVTNLGENAGANTGNAGSAAASGITNALVNTAAQQSNAFQNAGTANASGIAGGVNNIGTLLSNSSIQALINGNNNSSLLSTANQGVIDTGNSAYQQFEFSDRRAKTDIKKIGKAESGLNIYSFRLYGSPKTKIGVMSDEVRKVAPHAVRRDSRDGLDRVNYDAISNLPPMKRAA